LGWNAFAWAFAQPAGVLGIERQPKYGQRVTVIPPDPGNGGGAEYLARTLAARPDLDREQVYEKIGQLTNPRPGVQREPR
jgi:hypothetical protein